MSVFTLAISCLTTSNYHGHNIPGSYAILFIIASDFTAITSHIHNWVLFSFWFYLFIFSRVISPLISNSIFGTYWPGEFIFLSVSYLFAFSYCSWCSQGKNTEVVCHSLLQWTTFCKNSAPWPVPYLLALHSMAYSFIELDKAVIHVINWLVSCDCGFHSVFPLMDKDKRLMEAPWCERLALGESGSCSDGWGHTQ